MSGRVGICGAQSPFYGGASPYVCDLDAGHLGWHGAMPPGFEMLGIRTSWGRVDTDVARDPRWPESARISNLDDPFDLAAATDASARYGRLTDVEVAFAAHRAARHLHAALREIERLRRSSENALAVEDEA